MVDIEKALNYLRDIAADYAKHKAEAEFLREFRKSKKAILINEAERNGLKTAQERESYAYAHKDYIQLLEGLRVAIEESEKYRILIKAAEAKIDVWRSQNSRETAEMRLT